MNDLQKNSIDKLEGKNNEYIKELDILMDEVEREYLQFDDFCDWFWDLMNDMEQSNSQIPFLPYNNAYCIKDNKFLKAMRPCLSDNLYGNINEEYGILSEEYIGDLESKLEKEAGEMKGVLEAKVDIISDLIDRVIASNSITRRLSGLDEKYHELEKLSKMYWYPRELSKNEYQLTGQFIPPLALNLSQIQFKHPIHRELMIKYDYLFKTRSLHVAMLKKAKRILQYINEYLPFAEIVPLKESAGPTINNYNTVTPKQVQLGSENLFDGKVNIGNEGGFKVGDPDRK